MVKAFNEFDFNYDLLHKLTELAPGALFQLEVKQGGEMRFNFISRGIQTIHPDLNPELLSENPRLGFSTIHPEDIDQVRKEMEIASLNKTIWRSEFRVVESSGDIRWHSVHGSCDHKLDGTVIWYGIFQDITESKEYEKVLEQIMFDISHVIRRPASSISGILSLMEANNSENTQQVSLIEMLRKAVTELDQYTHQLNEAYHKRYSRTNQKPKN